MTGRFSKNITADSLTGMIFAAEGVKNTVVLLNGPMGCKFYHSTTSQFLEVRPPLYLPSADGTKVPVDYNYLNDFFFRQERVPCTYLDGYDYVYGSLQKVSEGLAFLRDNLDFGLVVIINSPGASLIGDRLEEAARQILTGGTFVTLESPGFSDDFDEGYGNAASKIVEAVLEEGLAGKENVPGGVRTGDGPAIAKGHTGKATHGAKSVNILGLSIWDRYWEGDREELIRMLSLCGIETNCVLCAGCSPDEIRRIPDADLNIVVNPRSGAGAAFFLKESFGMDCYVCDGLPVGFDASVRLCEEVSGILGTDASAVKAEAEEKRAYVWHKINDIYQISGKPDGTLFAVEGDAAAVLGYTRFLTEYLGMLPDCVSVSGKPAAGQAAALAALLSENGCLDALDKDIPDTGAELVFADANTIAMLIAMKKVFCGIEISQPGMGYTDIVKKTHLGINGGLFLTEQVLNGLMSRL